MTYQAKAISYWLVFEGVFSEHLRDGVCCFSQGHYQASPPIEVVRMVRNIGFVS